MDNKNIKYISLAEAAKLTNYSQDYISLLCRRRKMKGEKLGRNWFTTKEWLDDYINKTNGSGEIVVPVRIENTPKAKFNSANFQDKINQEPTASFLLTKKLVLATIFFSALVSALVFLQQGVIEKLTSNF
ncbi:MAG: hypothetical protein U9N04_04570 [Patescibacteria group bacterium]|nr:hypothetical protein [Patescibacteria group bacterium]